MPIVPTDFVQSGMPPGQLAYQQTHAKPDEFGARMAYTLELAGRSLERDALDRIVGTNVNDVYTNQFDPAFRGICQNFHRLGGKEAAEQLPAVNQGTKFDLASRTGYLWIYLTEKKYSPMIGEDFFSDFRTRFQ